MLITAGQHEIRLTKRNERPRVATQRYKSSRWPTVQLVAAMERKAAMVGIRELESLAAEFAAGPLLVHSDVMKAASFVGEYRGKEAFLESFKLWLDGDISQPSYVIANIVVTILIRDRRCIQRIRIAPELRELRPFCC